MTIPGTYDPWGSLARVQGLIIAPRGTLTDNGAGQVVIGAPGLRIISPLSGAKIDVAAGTYNLAADGALAVKIPPTSAEDATVVPDVISWTDTPRPYDHRDYIILGYRVGSGAVAWTFQSAPAITTSPLAGGPPANPKNGDIWIATDVTSGGANWQFVYNSDSAAAWKWEFIGGPVLNMERSANDPIAGDSVWHEDVSLGSLTIVRGGDYLVRASLYGSTAGAGAQTTATGYCFNHNPASGVIAPCWFSQNANWNFTAMWEINAYNAPAGTTIQHALWNNSGATLTASTRRLSVEPIRIA